MLNNIFIGVLNMSYMASIVIVAVLIIRMFLKKAPKKFSYILWCIPLLRLILPFSFESILSLIPVNPEPIPVDIGQAFSPQINTGVSSVDHSVNNILPVSEVATSMNSLQIIISIGAMIWIIIMMALIIYGIISYIKLKNKLVDAVLVEDNVYSSSKICSPFVIGIIEPKIYLPSSVIESEREYILLHERTHIKRFDHIFRFIGFLVLCIYWFNPLVWISYYISGKDMEMSCDESVISKLGSSVKKEYSQSLLNFTIKRSNFRISPLAFGEGDTKGRIKNILKFQKPKKYLIIVLVIILVILTIGLMANPIKNNSEISINGNTYGVVDVLYSSPIYSFAYTEDTVPSFNISSDYWLYAKEIESDWKLVNKLYETDMKKEELMTWIRFKDFLDEKTTKLLDQSKILYRADTENNVFYLILETENHKLLVLYGYVSEEYTSIRWIFEVESFESAELDLSLTELLSYRTKFVGNNSAVGNISNLLQYPDYLEYQNISLQTKKEPFAITINFHDKDQKFESSSDENTESFFEMNACILFSLVQNLDEVVFSVDGQVVRYTRIWVEEIMGINLWKASSSAESFNELLMNVKDKMEKK